MPYPSREIESGGSPRRRITASCPDDLGWSGLAQPVIGYRWSAGRGYIDEHFPKHQHHLAHPHRVRASDGSASYGCPPAFGPVGGDAPSDNEPAASFAWRIRCPHGCPLSLSGQVGDGYRAQSERPRRVVSCQRRAPELRPPLNPALHPVSWLWCRRASSCRMA